MNEAPVYRQRRGFFDRLTQITLTNNAMMIAVQGKPERVLPFSSITEIRLLHDPTRKHPDLYKCVVTTRGHGHFTIQNKTTTSIGQKIADHFGYSAIVRDLHGKLHIYGNQIRYRMGNRPLNYIWNIVFLCLVAAGCLWAFGVFGRVNLHRSLLHVAIAVAVLLPVAAFFMFRTRPRSYQPPPVPVDLLPTTD